MCDGEKVKNLQMLVSNLKVSWEQLSSDYKRLMTLLEKSEEKGKKLEAIIQNTDNE